MLSGAKSIFHELLNALQIAGNAFNNLIDNVKETELEEQVFDFNKDKLVRAFVSGKRFEFENETKFNQQLELLKQIKDHLPKCEGQLSQKDQEIIWNEAPIHPNFDPNVFRLDLVGKIVVFSDYTKDIKMLSVEKFRYDYEYIHSCSRGGHSQNYNYALLNKSINRTKGTEDIYKFSNLDWFKYNHIHYGISSKFLLVELEEDLISAKSKYGLNFEKVDGKWTVNKM